MSSASALAILVLALISGRIQAACSDGKCIISEQCSRNEDCLPGLICSNMCTSNFSVCTRAQSTDVLSMSRSLPFNKYAWLTTHNSFAIENSPPLTSSPILTFENQEDNVTQQLQNGVRGLMLDMYDFMNDIWVCHSFGGQCQNFTAFQPAVNTLQEIAAFLLANPSEIITIFIEDYVKSNNGLTNVFTRAGLVKYFFPVSKMPKDGSDWPTVSDMVANNQRLVVFTSISSKEASEGIAYQWNYVLENQYGDTGLKTCTNRAESSSLATKTKSLVLENYFPTNPDKTGACKENSKPLTQMLNTCYRAAGNRYANFLAVDFYKRSTGGGSFQAVDMLNGNLMCGCPDVHECQANLAQGVCNTTNLPQVAPLPDDTTSSPPTRSVSDSSASSTSSWPGTYFPYIISVFLAVLLA